MTFSRGWFFTFFVFVTSSDKVTGSLLRNNKGSSYEDDSQDVTQHEITFSDQFKNHEGGVINSPSGFLCLEVVEHLSTFGEDGQERFSCHYKEQGVLMTSKLGDIDGIFKDNFKRDSRLFLKGATYDESMNSIQITPEVQFIWLTTKQSQTEKETELRLIKTGTKTVLVFHITRNGSATTGSATQLSNWVFGTSGDSSTLKSQYEACSYNQLIFTPASGQNIVNGVVEVIVSTKSPEYDAISNAALQYARNELGIPVDNFDHWMFALPRGTTDGGKLPAWDGYAIGDRQTWFVDGEIRFSDLTVHELGHNLGLEHSREGKNPYGDLTCQMGISDGERRCFNAAKMYQLGWYMSREKTIDPVSEAFSGKIIGVNDYGISTSDHVLVLEIINSAKKNNLYLTFNKAEDMTADTGEYRNQVVVTEAAVNRAADIGSTSSLIAHVKAGSFATVANFSGSSALTISFERIGSDGNVDYAYVNIGLTSGVIS